MADLNSSTSNEKPNLDVLFPELKKTDTALPAPRFMAPATAAATLLKGAPPSARMVPPPPSRGMKPPPASVRPPPPSARVAPPAPVEQVDEEELLATSPEASPEPLEPIHPVDDEYVDEGPTVALPSPLLANPLPSRPLPTPPPSRRAAPPPSAAKLPPLPSAPASAKGSTPSAAKLPPVPLPPPSMRQVAPPSAPQAAPPALPPVYTEEEEEVVVRAPVSSKAAAAASLAAGSGPRRAYVPPSAPPQTARPVTALETIPASRAHSLVPTAATIPPPPLAAAPARAKKSSAGLVAVGGFLALALLGGLGVAAVKGSAALGLGSAATGTVAITASGPGGAKVDGLRVLVDGAVKCDSAPCQLTGLSAGTHFVSAEAPGFTTTAARAVSVERGAEAALHIDLSPAAAPAAAAAPKAEAKATALDDLKQEAAAKAPTETRAAERATKATEKQDARKADAKSDAKKAVTEPATGSGTLNINSIPVASVVLDGRPVGSTPLVGLKVSPGSHSVIFIHPEKGRKASGTTVKAGATSTVAVRF